MKHRAGDEQHIPLAKLEKAVINEVFTLALHQKIQLIGAVVVHRVHRTPVLFLFNKKISRLDKLDLRHGTLPPLLFDVIFIIHDCRSKIKHICAINYKFSKRGQDFDIILTKHPL